MKQICPKCKKEGRFGYFDTPDNEGVVGMFTHVIGKKKVKDVLGEEHIVDDKIRCFLTLEELQKEPWFKSWKRKHENELKKLIKKHEKQWGEQYYKDYEKEFVKEQKGEN